MLEGHAVRRATSEASRFRTDLADGAESGSFGGYRYNSINGVGGFWASHLRIRRAIDSARGSIESRQTKRLATISIDNSVAAICTKPSSDFLALLAVVMKKCKSAAAKAEACSFLTGYKEHANGQ